MPHGFEQALSDAGASVLLCLLHATTLFGLLWLAVSAVTLAREWAGLNRVRTLFAVELPATATAADIAHWWTTAAGRLPSGWTVSRVAALVEAGAGGASTADSLRLLTARNAAPMAEVTRVACGILLLLGLSGAVASLGACLATGKAEAGAAVMGAPLLRAALPPLFAGLVSAAGLLAVAAILRQFQLALLARLETFSLTVLEPRLLPADAPAALAQTVALLAESSRQLCSAAQPLAAGLEHVAGTLQGSADEFSRRLEHASQNLLQCVESVRAAAVEFRQSAGTVGDHYDQLEAMHRHVEAMASQLAGSHEQSQARLEAITDGLHGVTQSLTTVVASANQAQETVAGVAVAVTESVERLDGSVGRLVEGLQEPGCAARAAASAGSNDAAGVTLRQMVEVQRQFINTLDHRLARVTAAKPGTARAPEHLSA